MKRHPKYEQELGLKVDETFEGKTLEQEVEKMIVEKTPIDNSKPMIYTDRADGVIAGYNIRTDKWEIAQNAMSKVSKATEWSKVLMKDGTPKFKEDGSFDLSEPEPKAKEGPKESA